jgi:hypothetical protein
MYSRYTAPCRSHSDALLSATRLSNDTHRVWHGVGSVGASRPASASAPSGADADAARSVADHLPDSGVETGTMAMRTTSSMQPPLSTAIVPTEPAAVLGMGASAQTQSGRYLSASLRPRVLSSLAHKSHRSPYDWVRRHACARMHGYLNAYLRGCVTWCLCAHAHVCQVYELVVLSRA